MLARAALGLIVGLSLLACSMPIVTPVPATPVPATLVTASPTSTSAPGVGLVVQLGGVIGCNQFPYGCLARLSVLPAGTDVAATWRPTAKDAGWGPAGMGSDTLDPTPFRPLPTLAPGDSRLVVSLLGSYDTPSYAPDDSIATDLLARCALDVEVDPAAGPVTVRVKFTTDGVSFGGRCVMERVD